MMPKRMNRFCGRTILVLALVLATKAASAATAFSWFALAAPTPTLPAESGSSPGLQCRDAIRAIERTSGIPPPLMTAIAHVESGRRTARGGIDPWPWSLNVEGVDHVYDSKAEAIAAVRQMQQSGIRSIDVGCMQVNLMYHPNAFATLDDAFDPVSNARYAASFLVQLHGQTGSWPQATADYHSATPELGADYAHKVMAVMAEEARHDPPGGTWASVEPRPVQSGSIQAASIRMAPEVPAVAAGRGAVMLSQHLTTARMLQMPSTVGRSLAAYRGAPVQLAWRPPVMRPLLP